MEKSQAMWRGCTSTLAIRSCIRALRSSPLALAWLDVSWYLARLCSRASSTSLGAAGTAGAAVGVGAEGGGMGKTALGLSALTVASMWPYVECATPSGKHFHGAETVKSGGTPSNSKAQNTSVETFLTLGCSVSNNLWWGRWNICRNANLGMLAGVKGLSRKSKIKFLIGNQLNKSVFPMTELKQPQHLGMYCPFLFNTVSPGMNTLSCPFRQLEQRFCHAGAPFSLNVEVRMSWAAWKKLLLRESKTEREKGHGETQHMGCSNTVKKEKVLSTLPGASATGWVTCTFCLAGGPFTGTESPCVSGKSITGFTAGKSGSYIRNFPKISWVVVVVPLDPFFKKLPFRHCIIILIMIIFLQKQKSGVFFTLTWRWRKTTQVHRQSILQRGHHPVELLHQKRTTQKGLSNIMTVIVVQARITWMPHILRPRRSARRTSNSPSASYKPAEAIEMTNVKETQYCISLTVVATLILFSFLL